MKISKKAISVALALGSTMSIALADSAVKVAVSKTATPITTESLNRFEFSPLSPFLGTMSFTLSRKISPIENFGPVYVGLKAGLSQVAYGSQDLSGSEIGAVVTKELTPFYAAPYLKTDLTGVTLKSKDTEVRYANLRGLLGYGYTDKITGLGVGIEAGVSYKNGTVTGESEQVKMPMAGKMEIENGHFAIIHPDVGLNITYKF